MASPPDRSVRRYLPDAPATERVGAALGPTLGGGMVVTLSGDLGAGKTTLVRGLLRGLGWEGPVKSPTYSLVEHYAVSSLYFYHFDFYRFADPSEWETAGLSECFRDDSVCLVEWPERIAGLLPPADAEVTLTHASPEGAGRMLTVSARRASGNRCVAAIESLSLPP